MLTSWVQLTLQPCRKHSGSVGKEGTLSKNKQDSPGQRIRAATSSSSMSVMKCRLNVAGLHFLLGARCLPSRCFTERVFSLASCLVQSFKTPDTPRATDRRPLSHGQQRLSRLAFGGSSSPFHVSSGRPGSPAVLQTGRRIIVTSCCRTQETHTTQTQQCRIHHAWGGHGRKPDKNRRKAGKHSFKCRNTPCRVTRLSRLQPPPHPFSFPLLF